MTETRIDYSLGEYQSAVNGALEKMRKDNIIARIRAKDYTVWKPAPDEITNRLGWLDAPAETLKKMDDIHAAIDPLTQGSISDVVLLGMGGSSLAAEVFNNIFGSKTGYPQLHIVDTTDPVFISTVTKRLNLEKTIFLVSSKSGTTLEIISLFKYFYNLVLRNSGNGAGRRFVFITDEGSPLIKIAKNISAHHTFLNNPDIGGRYSALSLPGIVPAAMIGVDVVKLLQRAIDAKLSDSGASLGAALGTLAQMGRDKLTFIMPSGWQSFGDWLEQLIAESTGKEGKGILPILNEPLTDSAAYGRDRVFVVFQNKEAVISSPIESLVKAGHPVIKVEINDDYDLGAQMFIWEIATAVAAHFLNINPFDQPDVETTKKYTRVMITEHKEKKNMIDAKPALTFAQGDIFGKISGATLGEVFKNFLKRAVVDNYISLQIYLSPSGEIDTAVGHLREAISKKLALPVTFGYGPRYLHSTGQLHKGDSGKGLFIQFTQDNAMDVDIPDDPGKAESSLTFGALKAAQATGDWRALQDKGRRIIRIHFRENPIAGFKNLAEIL
ncbi:MAG: glucose-6-phosphate isomerase [Deltaproteobacteria bacterium HGW-Deltaproteobacteria-13]|nr:MAG: glucose-6-phosphate isomerase [Deltaproteobacteria bacterium HGW-Deltaproteobacteria-13]